MGSTFDSIVTLIPAGGWQRLMVDVIWQSTLVGLLAFVVSAWFIRQAAARAWLLLIATTLCIVIPMVSLCVRSGGWVIPISVGAIDVATSDAVTAGNIKLAEKGSRRGDRAAGTTRHHPQTSNVNPFGGRNSSGRHSTTSGRSASIQSPLQEQNASRVSVKGSMRQIHSLLIAMGGVWLVCSLFQLYRLAISAMAVRRMMSQCEPCEDSQRQTTLAHVSKRLGLAKPPRLLVSDRISAPMILAYFQPALLIPTVTSARDREEFEMTCAHELAHIRRHDGWTKLWFQFTAVVIPFQPLVWWMRKSFFEACEEACDDWAIAFGSDPIDFASVLATWSDGSHNKRELAFAAGMSGTRARILRLLAMKDTPRATLSMRWRCGASMAAILMCLGFGFAQPSSLVTQAQAQTGIDDGGQEAAQEVSPTERSDAENQAANSISISGVCVNEENDPLPGARVRLFRVSYASATITQTELRSSPCDPNGAYTFEDVGRAGEFENLILIGQHADRATVSEYVAKEASSDQTFTLKLQPAATLIGRVVDEDGNPVSGAVVSAGSALGVVVPGICAAVSGTDGNYSITDLTPFDLVNQKPQSTGDGVFEQVSHCFGQVQHSDYARDRFQYSKVPGTANITVQRPAIVRGQITLKETEAAAIGAQVEFWSDTIAADSWTRATADDDGRFRIEYLPPGEYRVNIRYAGRPNLTIPSMTLSTGSNRKDFSMELGGVIKGSVIDVHTEEPIRLSKDETMQISATDQRGRWFAGMPTADIQPDGSFALMLPAGRRHFGMYFGPNWQGVNTDRLFETGIQVIEGETTELQIRVRRRDRNRPSDPKVLSNGAAELMAEQAAIAAVKELGGWVERETIDGEKRVVEVNMVYHDDERMGRLENQLICDECLSYVQKFPKLKRLMLYREQATDEGLAKLSGMESLEGIWVWDASAVTDAGAAHLSQLKNLREIHLANSNLTDDALEFFSRLQKIERLSLQGNRFTNRGLEHLQRATQLKELVLGLGNNEFTDDGLRFLSGLTNLERLGLQNSDITDAGLRQLRSLKELKQLWVSGTNVTESGRAKLSSELPKLEPLSP